MKLASAPFWDIAHRACYALDTAGARHRIRVDRDVSGRTEIVLTPRQRKRLRIALTNKRRAGR